MTNQDYKNAALAALKGNWAPAVLATVVYVLIALVCVSGSEVNTFVPGMPMKTVLAFAGGTTLLELFILLPLDLGFYWAFKLLLDKGDADLTKNTFKYGFNGYWHNVGGYFFMELKVILWCLLFIIPGLVMSFAYAMTPFILKDNPGISAWKASTMSREMMKGHKFDLFWLYLSFIGWGLLCILTLGIGLLWLVPYMTEATAAFYNDISGKNAPVAVEAAPAAEIAEN